MWIHQFSPEVNTAATYWKWKKQQMTFGHMTSDCRRILGIPQQAVASEAGVVLVVQCENKHLSVILLTDSKNTSASHQSLIQTWR